jgi:predicted transcriptional regulator
MIAILPASIEQYLKDAKFSATEILVIRKLLEEDALTLRELATKTGKSTGVLDQALKKLIGKGIVHKQAINGGYKYIMASLKPILEWMEKDMKQKYELLERRHQNFEAFIASLTVDKARPEMQYFDGEDGIKRAYIKLLEQGKELLCYWPLECFWDEHPLKDFYVQYFRERHRRGMFSRVISHDTAFGRRFQSRDPFEYRKTILVPEAELPMPFEKVIAGDIVACFNHKQQQACFIKYPEFAHAERMLFENHWKEAQRKQLQEAVSDTAEESALQPETGALEPVLQSPEIELRTKILSKLREFFLSKASVIAFVVCAVAGLAATLGGHVMRGGGIDALSLRTFVPLVVFLVCFLGFAVLRFGALNKSLLREVMKIATIRNLAWSLVLCALLATGGSYLLSSQTAYLNLQRVREQVRSVAATAALQFDAGVIDAIRAPQDVRKPQHAVLVRQLADVRKQNPSVKHVYIMRLSGDALSFVADADALHAPGDAHEKDPESLVSAITKNEASADETPYTDQLGTFISGAAPIRNAQGEAVALVGLDIDATRLHELAKESRWSLYLLLGLATLFLLANRKLCVLLFKRATVRSAVLGIAACGVLALVGTYGMYMQTLSILKTELSEKLMSIASTAATQFDVKDLDQLRFARDMKTEAYQRVFRTLNQIRDNNPDIRYAYIMRKVDDGMGEFVADADSNYDLPFLRDDNNDGVLDELDEAVAPGERYYPSSPYFIKGFEAPTPDPEIISDQWGTFIAGYAPVHTDSSQNYMIELDMDVSSVYEQVDQNLSVWIWFFTLFSGTTIAMIVVTQSKKRAITH